MKFVSYFLYDQPRLLETTLLIESDSSKRWIADQESKLCPSYHIQNSPSAHPAFRIVPCSEDYGTDRMLFAEK